MKKPRSENFTAGPVAIPMRVLVRANGNRSFVCSETQRSINPYQYDKYEENNANYNIYVCKQSPHHSCNLQIGPSGPFIFC